MKIKTWEKWYWGIDLVLIICELINYYSGNLEMPVEGGGTRPMTGTEAIMGIFILYVVIAGLLWLIIRFFANKDKKLINFFR